MVVQKVIEGKDKACNIYSTVISVDCTVHFLIYKTHNISSEIVGNKQQQHIKV